MEYAPLNEQKAVEVGAEMLGELFLYSTAASFIFYEYWRSAKKDEIKENATDAILEELTNSVKILNKELAEIKEQLKKTEAGKRADKNKKS